MIVIWRGWGLLAFFLALLPFGSCVGLINWNTRATFIAVGVSFLVGGLTCRVVGSYAAARQPA